MERPVIAEQHGLEAGLEALATLDPTLVPGYQPYWATRGHLLARQGDWAQAKDTFTRAIGHSGNVPTRDFLIGRLNRCGNSIP